MNRRSFLKTAALSAATLPWALREAVGASWARPNLLFVLTDQWRFCAFSLGEVNDAQVQTPHLDEFAEDGVRWRKAFASNPVCTPERATIMTGRYPHQTGMIKNDVMIPPGNRCLAEVFHEQGYATHYIGKTHYDGTAKPGFLPHGWRRRGFTTYEGFNRGHNYTSNQTYFEDDGTQVYPDEYEPKTQTDLAIDFIRGNRHRPWFCYLSWGPPHTPYGQVPAEYKTYSLSEADRRPNVPAGNPGSGNLADYFAQCTALDAQFGRLTAELKRLGLEQNTLVVFTSDHGDMHRSHNLTYKGKPEEESLHIPLFMRWPGRIGSSQTPDTLIGGVDMMPTVLSLCGLPVPDSCAGINKAGAVLGDPPAVDSIYCEGAMTATDGSAWRSLVTDRYKLVSQDTGSLDIHSVTKFWDLRDDPYELNNLVNDAGHAALKQQLFDRLVQWRNETGDTFPVMPPQAKTMYT